MYCGKVHGLSSTRQARPTSCLTQASRVCGSKDAMGDAGNMQGIRKEHGRNMQGILGEHARNMHGILEGRVEYAQNTGECVECVQDYAGVGGEYARSLGEHEGIYKTD